MRIAITGASGFIGSELVERLAKEDGVEVVGLTRNVDTNSTSAGIETDSRSRVKLEWRYTDYSEESLKKALEDINVVVHLAAVRGTTSNREDYVINETITENILKAMISNGVSRIVFASTTSVYDDVSKIPWKESDELSPRTMYGASKIECEKLIQEYAGEAGKMECGFARGFNYSIVRIAQVLGLGEKRRGMMNVFMDTAAAGGEISVMGKSESKRQYVYVKDLVEVMTRLALQTGNESQILNVGMPNAYSVLEIAQLANKAWGNETPVNYDASTPEKVVPACMDISKLKQVLGYEPMDMLEAFEDIKKNQ